MACLTEPNSCGSDGAISGPEFVGAAPRPDPRDGCGRWPAVTAYRGVDCSAVETEAGGGIAARQRGAHESRGGGRQPEHVGVGCGKR